eukprot:TRINITY_DN2062_c1_g1_i1.p1 TRINITY_DN2062_c1_g1~~TRINITY_DN2062_c1_g1_i1.p1  ORF type:complete len:190 (-),score=61.43 TRINITY_DN2062_c1_g1_i1:67-579(-)
MHENSRKIELLSREDKSFDFQLITRYISECRLEKIPEQVYKERNMTLEEKFKTKTNVPNIHKMALLMAQERDMRCRNITQMTTSNSFVNEESFKKQQAKRNRSGALMNPILRQIERIEQQSEQEKLVILGSFPTKNQTRQDVTKQTEQHPTNQTEHVTKQNELHVTKQNE